MGADAQQVSDPPGDQIAELLRRRSATRSHVLGNCNGTKVLQACKERNAAGVRHALAIAPGSVLSRGDFEQTALHIACALPHLELTKLLLDSGADVNAQGKLLSWLMPFLSSTRLLSLYLPLLVVLCAIC